MEKEAAWDVHMQKACGPAVVHLTPAPLYADDIWIYKTDIQAHFILTHAGETDFTKAITMEIVHFNENELDNQHYHCNQCNYYLTRALGGFVLSSC